MRTGKTNSKLGKRILTVMIACAVIGLILSVILFLTEADPVKVTSVLQLSFKSAADGLAPNGSRFGVDDITDDEVLNTALESSGLSDRYTAEAIRSCLSVTGIYPDDLQKQMNSYDSLLDFSTSREFSLKRFNPTQFNVVLTNEFDPSVSRKDLEKLLKAILETYKEGFIRTYSVGFDVSGYDRLFELSSYDYPQMLQVIEMEITQAATYAEELYTINPAFRYEGMGFNDVYIRLNNLVENDIVRMNANLTMNALTKDTERLLMQYECEIRDRENEQIHLTAELMNLDKLLNAYDKNEIIYLSTSETLTKIDGNSSETYDALVETRKTVADRITVIRTEIRNYQLKMADLKGTSVTEPPEEEETAPADTEGTEIAVTSSNAGESADTVRIETGNAEPLETDIADLLLRKDAILQDFDGMLQSFNAVELNNGTVSSNAVRYKPNSFISGTFAVKCIKTAGPVCVIGILICLIMLIRKERKSA